MRNGSAFCTRGRLAAIGAPQQLKARVGPGATLDDVFAEIVGLARSTAGGSLS